MGTKYVKMGKSYEIISLIESLLTVVVSLYTILFQTLLLQL